MMTKYGHIPPFALMTYHLNALQYGVGFTFDECRDFWNIQSCSSLGERDDQARRRKITAGAGRDLSYYIWGSHAWEQLPAGMAVSIGSEELQISHELQRLNFRNRTDVAINYYLNDILVQQLAALRNSETKTVDYVLKHHFNVQRAALIDQGRLGVTIARPTALQSRIDWYIARSADNQEGELILSLVAEYAPPDLELPTTSIGWQLHYIAPIVIPANVFGLEEMKIKITM